MHRKRFLELVETLLEVFDCTTLQLVLTTTLHRFFDGTSSNILHVGHFPSKMDYVGTLQCSKIITTLLMPQDCRSLSEIQLERNLIEHNNSKQ